ncbi:hypothetical protein [Flavobacterium sp. CSZ]|uniref:hypothetical protein n=1 Tax=Flavobacterium sp. CSZ TaxID=2783791 RepID=UPI00188D15EB|nr:hypothetical protein [Flavobacterium sp. CSZ]MBF4484033.1 hypothetical protein [Flavobacterium sp. CSZ]
MKKLSFLKSTFSFALLIFMSISVISCISGSYNDNASSGTAFNPVNFSLTITKKEVAATVGLMITYDLKNISKDAYNDYTQGSFSVKFTVKGTDGETFQDIVSMDYIDAGITFCGLTFLDYSEVKTLDLSTLTAVIIKNK